MFHTFFLVVDLSMV